MIRILDELRRRRAKEKAENDVLVERLHTAYRNTVDDGWEELVAKKRLQFPEHRLLGDTTVHTKIISTKYHFPKMRVGYAIALCAVLVGVSFLFARESIRRPQVFWGTVPPPKFSIIGSDPVYAFTDRLFDTDGMIVPAGKYPEGISLNLARRIEYAQGGDVQFVVRYVITREDRSLVFGVAVLPREEIFRMAGLGYKLTDYTFHR